MTKPTNSPSGAIRFKSDAFNPNEFKGGLGEQQAKLAQTMTKQELASRGGDPLTPKKLRKSA